MKKFIISFLIFCFVSIPVLLFAADVYVRGYIKKDGTYVAPHYRTSPDGNPYNNYSTRGNTNPHTGEKGYVDPNKSYNTYSPPWQHQNSSQSGFGSKNNFWDK